MQGQSRTPEFLALSPQGQVPVLQLEDGRVLAQSNAIIRYLARDTPLLPADPYLQAKTDEWLFWEQYSHEPYITVCRFHMHYLKKPKAAREPWRVERGETALDLMAAHLSSYEWLVGDTLKIADIALYVYTHVAAEGGFSLQSRPSVRAWVARCADLWPAEPDV
jgi:glutathione S-transferase